MLAIVKKKKVEMERMCMRLDIIPAHYTVHLLQRSLDCTRLLFGLRSCPSNGREELVEFDDLISIFLEKILNIQLKEEARQHAFLPTILSGLRSRSCKDIAMPAYLSSLT